VDVGANAGYYTAIAGSLVGPSGHVYAFEPNPPLARLLRETVALNHHQSRTKVEAIAVSSTGGSVRLFRPTDPGATGAATTVPLPSQRVEPGLAVPSVALDKFVSGLGIRSIRLVKVDVEGAELDVLAGATQTLRTVKPDALLCEFCPQLLPDPQSTWREMLRVLGLFGYYPFFLDLSGRLELGSSRMPTWKVGNVCFKQIE
jgi:FkbM family methyltransferase